MTATPPRLAWHPQSGMLARWCVQYGQWRWILLGADDGSTPTGPKRTGMDPETDPGWVAMRLELDR